MIAFTTHCYLISRVLGPDLGSRCMHQAFSGFVPEVNDMPIPLCVEAYRRIESLCQHDDDQTTEEIQRYADLSGAPHGKARSRALHWVRDIDADIWITCDDQCSADTTAIRAMLQAVRYPLPTCVIVPHVGRDARTVNVHGARMTSDTMHAEIEWGGMGLVAMNRAAINQVAAAHPELEYIDSDGKRRLGLFHEHFDHVHNKWWGEDASFWHRLPRTVQRIAITTGYSVHAGFELDLAQWASKIAHTKGD